MLKKQRIDWSKVGRFILAVFFLISGGYYVDQGITWAENLKERPIIKEGTFFRDDQPVYFLGPFLSLVGLADQRAIRPGADPFSPLYPIYSNVLNFELARLVGFNSAQPFTPTVMVAEKFAPQLLEGKRGERFKSRKEEYIKFLEGFRGLPIVVDFSPMGLPANCFTGHAVERLIQSRPDKWSSDILQQNKDWHAFVPFCPENPKGWALYETYFRTGAELVLKAGGNPFIYEIFNQPAYQCRCRWNQQMFRDRMESQYGQIGRANIVWGTEFESFDELMNTTEYEKFSGLWVDWLKFIGDRYVEILLKAKETIQQVDRRDRVYFMEQPHMITSYLRTCGIDPYKVAQVMDVIGVEAAVGFGWGGFVAKEAMELLFESQPLSLTHQLYLDMARSFGKPIVNTEWNSDRRYNGIRFPTRRSDFPTGLWVEVMRGVSANYIYNWDKRSWDWTTMAEAKVNARERGFKGRSLLNPYAYPPESLLGIKDFREEIELLKEIVLPRPRIKGKIALLISQPTVRMVMRGRSAITENSYELSVKAFYDALSFSHYPLDVIFEEQLEVGSGVKGIGARPLYEYEALIIPSAEFVYEKTPAILNKFLNRGGLVIATEGSLSKDEYGHQLKTLEAEKITWIDPNLKGEYLRKKLVSILEEHKISKPFCIVADGDGGHVPFIEGLLIDRGRTKLYCLINWQVHSKLVRLKVNSSPEGDSFYVIDPLRKEFYLSPTASERWTVDDLRKGILLSLPPQERVLVIITSDLQKAKDLFASKKSVSEGTISVRYKKSAMKDKTYVQAIQRELRQIEIMQQEKNIFTHVNKERCFFIDISSQANMAFQDDVPNDQKGGWTDQGSNDLRFFPVGIQTFSGVPFKIIDPEENSGRSCIILKGSPRPYFPEKVKNIQVNEKVKYLYFLHTVAWGDKGELFKYRVFYDDGSIEEIPINYKSEVRGWWGGVAATRAKIAWLGKNAATNKIAVYCYRWSNPRPEVTITRLDIISNNTRAVPAIIAITGERPGK